VSVSISRVLRRVPDLVRRPYVPPEELAYRRLRQKGFEPRSIIDIGAYEGNWTRLAHRVFPGVQTLMIEAQAGKVPFLEEVCRELPNVRFTSALLGPEAGRTIDFYEMETGSSVFPERSDVPRETVTLQMLTLDQVGGELDGPVFLKVDVQGAELEVLAGAPRLLERCEVIQLEVALVPYNEGAPTMLDVLRYMDERNFVPLDVSGFSRPNGVDLAQMDILFVPKSSPLRTLFFTFRN
jgi:FkbM family methyltransferase